VRARPQPPHEVRPVLRPRGTEVAKGHDVHARLRGERVQEGAARGSHGHLIQGDQAVVRALGHPHRLPGSKRKRGSGRVHGK